MEGAFYWGGKALSTPKQPKWTNIDQFPFARHIIAKKVGTPQTTKGLKAPLK